jgi:hypothetical protein
MWMVWFLMTLIGVCLVLSLFERPPIAVSVSVFERDGEGVVASRRLDDPDASRREVSARGGPR